MSTKQTYVTGVRYRLSYPQELDEPTIQDAVNRAVILYSKIRPKQAVTDFSGDGSSYDFTLPSDWVEGYSRILQVEFPTGNQQATILKSHKYTVYQSATDTYVFRLIEDTPSSTQTVRVTYTIPYTVNDSSSDVRAQDEEALIDLAAAFCARVLSAKAAQTTQSSLDADPINYLAKVDHWSNVAKRLEGLFKQHFGITSETWIQAVNAVMDVDALFPWGHDMIIHTRSWR
jgi:hypothetical protein